MDKSPDAFRTISEVAETLDTPAHVLRFWESRFPQIKPVKRAGGRRYYRPNDVALLSGIRRLLHDDGMTIRGVQKILREQGVRYVASLSGAAPEPEEAEEALNIFSPPAPPPAGAEVIALRDWAPPVAELEPDAVNPADTDPAAGPETDAPPDLPGPDAEDDEMRRPHSQPLIEDPQQPSLFDLPPDAAEVPDTGETEEAGPPSDIPPGAADTAAPMADTAPPAPMEPTPDTDSGEPMPAQEEIPSDPARPDTADTAPAPAPAAPQDAATPDAASAVPGPAQAAPPPAPAAADSSCPDPCDLPWLPALLRALPRDQAAARAGTLASLRPRLEALHERLAQTRRRPG